MSKMEKQDVKKTGRYFTAWPPRKNAGPPTTTASPYYTIAAIGTLIIIGFFALAGQINAPSLDDVVIPESLETPPNADGKTWGPADAPVIIEEFGDFQ